MKILSKQSPKVYIKRGLLALLAVLIVGAVYLSLNPASAPGVASGRNDRDAEVMDVEVTQTVAVGQSEIVTTFTPMPVVVTEVPTEEPEAEVEWTSSPYNFTWLDGICYSKPLAWKWWITEKPIDCFGSENVTAITKETIELPAGMKVLVVGAKFPSGNTFQSVIDGKMIEAPADGMVTVCKTQQNLDKIQGKLNVSYSIVKIEDKQVFTGRVTGECYTVEDYKESQLTQALIWEALNPNPKAWDLTDIFFTIRFDAGLSSSWLGDQALTNLP